MKLWVDDIRNAPDETWIVARTVTAAIRLIANNPHIKEISLDHDISHQVQVGALSRPYPCEETFMSVVYFLAVICENRKRDFSADEWTPPAITIHTSNTVAAKEMGNVLSHYGLPATLKLMGLANRLEMEHRN